MICPHSRVRIGGNFYVIGICEDCGEPALAPGRTNRKSENPEKTPSENGRNPPIADNVKV